MVKVVKKAAKYLIIHLASFCLNYLIFIIGMFFVNHDNVIIINIINLLAWIASMIFIFFIDKIWVPDLIDENNNSELFKFILIRVFSLIIESMIIFIFIIVLNKNHYLVKLISLFLLFVLNEVYVRKIQLK